MEYTGNEFKPGDNALLDWGNNLITAITVIRWDIAYGGWWYVQLENGGMHYTRRLLIK